MTSLKKIIELFALSVAALLLIGSLIGFGGYLLLTPKLPSIETLKDVRLQVPLRVYSKTGLLIAEYGEMKRSPLKFFEIPDNMIKAILAAEDNRFFIHPGVDYQGILRAVVNLVKTGRKSQGGSTITMQVARNFFLSRKKSYLRKINEILLSFKIEQELSKEEILELYLNKIYLGHRAYGISAAAQIYYGKTIDELSTAQMAMIAGLPKAPSSNNPVTNPERALIRRNYILQQMKNHGYIDHGHYILSINETDSAKIHGLEIELEAPYIAEMVRKEMLKRYGKEAYTGGFKVFTTIEKAKQIAANNAVHSALLGYDKRHCYRGTSGHVDFSTLNSADDWKKQLALVKPVGNTRAALIISIEAQQIFAVLADEQLISLDWNQLSWARKFIDDNHCEKAPESASDIFSQGDIIRVAAENPGDWQLAQIPAVEGALVSLLPKDGAIIALTGGFDFYHSKFNRVTQAERQPGSNFKPFIYSAALEKGFTTASMINDAPVVFDDPGLENAWRPENYSGKFYGPTRLREALIRSRNLISIRLLRASGIKSTINYVSRFGFDPQKLPHDLSLSLGSGSITPLQLAQGYASFANGGYAITPYFIHTIEDSLGNEIYKARPATVCPNCNNKIAQKLDNTLKPEKDVKLDENEQPLDQKELAENMPVNEAPRIITAQNAYLITSMMRDVIKRGTGRRARSLRRNDLSGKTGTTNDQRDAWFSGFNEDLVTVSWVGFDLTRSLGNRETGARAALPMWIAYMKEALKTFPEKMLTRPPGLVTVRIDPENGLLANVNTKNAMFETFRSEYAPTRRSENKNIPVDPETESEMDPLF